MAVTPPGTGVYPGVGIFPNAGDLWPGDGIFPGGNVFPGSAPILYYFTPPHRGRFVPQSDPRFPASMSQPWRSMAATIPRPPNLWLHDDGLLREEQPTSYNANTKMFAGGHIYGPLTDADIALLTTSGFAGYIITNSKPVPQP